MNSLLQIKQASLSFFKDKMILNKVDFTLNKGDFLIILGSNGSGKSSLMKLMNRQYTATSGEVNLMNRPIQSFDKKELIHELVTLNQFINNTLFMDLTLEENAILLEMSLNKAFKREILLAEIKYELSQYHSTLANSLKTTVSSLSGGEQQIAAFALYLRRQPKLLLLDEHTSALDPKTSANIMKITDEIIKKKGLTCVMTTHNLDYAMNYGNRLIAMKEGEIFYQADYDKKRTLTKLDLIEMCY